ncbi:hypothetical protein MUN82_12845 [Hymenobacter aerilatus]|uniref:Uncharacterized protein n=1 Tax=Hymenobacter aerilatus TaxID=2932251 RepID=A0A8T9SS33_9BACT|nr:hypothetical protein [Hymenobacter aerilatus]UOR03834.1 hypothetical protein MUN82_12845 [Hymenobacter aerilatus]
MNKINGGGLLGSASSVVLVNDELDAHVVHGQRVAERAGLTHEHDAALT